ncbi:MAG: two-component system response regulator [Thermonema sp.]|uniref:T9SS response regulator signal transducer PorX n=1 Tax=Thermonema sp. TaxID=2231181 RepID=UPI0021DB89D8|nr:PglZ domain-containing protein [Thermonema sp.]GIV38662.1 MAG: two-component system response regulator [Thermonema sp.]
MQQYRILWADDEIDLLKPHILFLKQKGYEVVAVNSGTDALERIREEPFDIVFLDENMPGLTGLETLVEIKEHKPDLPVVMITKAEEESIMEEAIGAKIADYLIKPLNSSQILLSVKKILENRRIVSEKVNLAYQQDFRNISMAYMDRLSHDEWAEIYKKLVYWEIEIENTEEQSMEEVLESQKSEANTNFVKFIKENYEDWLNEPNIDRPILSHQLMQKKVFPLLKKMGENDTLFFILIDNLRYDQWRVLAQEISRYFYIVEESTYYSILPTTTAYARNAIFSGMLPDDMAKFYTKWWVEDTEEEGKNLHEEEFLRNQLDKFGFRHIRMAYHKILTNAQGRTVNEQFAQLKNNHLNAIVYNFVDMLSHARTDVEMIRELAPDEAAYRALTHTWFIHSPLFDLLKKIAEHKLPCIITTDHGTIRVRRPFRIVGDREVNTNLRYKHGKNLSFKDDGKVLEARKPERFHLPKQHVSTSYVFATEDYFFVYPNNYNYYVNFFKDTFQHGGISLEEMIVPFVYLEPK